jgi:prepilin-type N-terminal cleavage/methylation domain-containing protein
MPRNLRQSGFTLIELMITMCIAAILGSIAIAQMRDYTRRAHVSEVVMATTQCKNAITENYATLDTGPAAGHWGCESPTGGTEYAGPVQTSADGVIRVAVANLDSLVNGHYVYLVPARASGAAMVASNNLGQSVQLWICGSDWQPVRNALPANCRSDTTSFASQTFQ